MLQGLYASSWRREPDFSAAVGRFADLSSRRVMMVTRNLTASNGLVVYLLDNPQPAWLAIGWMPAGAKNFRLSIASTKARIGRKLHVVDSCSSNRRTDYVAVGNNNADPAAARLRWSPLAADGGQPDHPPVIHARRPRRSDGRRIARG
jgi:hypothetical protein